MKTFQTCWRGISHQESGRTIAEKKANFAGGNSPPDRPPAQRDGVVVKAWAILSQTIGRRPSYHEAGGSRHRILARQGHGRRPADAGGLVQARTPGPPDDLGTQR